MRTTVTLPDDLVKKALKITREKRLSDALVVCLTDYIRQKTALSLFDGLFPGGFAKSPRDFGMSYEDVKKERKKSKWSS